MAAIDDQEEVKPPRGILAPVGDGWRTLVRGANNNMVNYYILLVCAIVLTFLGLLMVLSASGTSQVSEGQDWWNLALRQFIWGLLGMIVMVVFSFLPEGVFKKCAWPAMIIILILLALVVFTPLGIEVNGNRNWLSLGGQNNPLSFQPSEAAKLVLCVWLAYIFSLKKHKLNQLSQVFFPAVPVSLAVIGLVYMGHDLGTVLILLLIIFAAFIFAGIKMKWIIFAAVTMIILTILAVISSDNRMKRIMDVWTGSDSGVDDTGWQQINGLYALASGGFFGRGIGNSRQKWSWIPESHSDYIFAILGEELGFLGSFLVLVLFVIICAVGIRIALFTQDFFIRVCSGAIVVGLAGQAFINIGMVIGFLPVIGIPLPFISYGGSALTFSLAGIGLLMSFARNEEKRIHPENFGRDKNKGSSSQKKLQAYSPKLRSQGNVMAGNEVVRVEVDEKVGGLTRQEIVDTKNSRKVKVLAQSSLKRSRAKTSKNVSSHSLKRPQEQTSAQIITPSPESKSEAQTLTSPRQQTKTSTAASSPEPNMKSKSNYTPGGQRRKQQPKKPRVDQ